MILRRVIEHVKAQNWTAVALDFVIVVMGVFMGIQVSNWNETRKSRAVAETFLARIADDLSVIETSMESNLVMASWVEAHMIDAIDALSSDNIPATAEFLLDTYISGYKPTGIVADQSLQELMSSDTFDQVSDATVRERLKRFSLIARNAEEEFAEQTDYQSAYRRAMPHRVISLLRTHCGDAGAGRTLEGVTRFVIPDTCPPALSDEQIEESVRNLMAENLLPVLREALANVQVKQMQYRIVVDEAAALRDFLKGSGQ